MNAIIKGDGGLIGLTENENAMKCWMTAATEVSRILAEFESKFSSKKNTNHDHHEQSPAIQRSFVEDVANLINVVQKCK